MSALATLASAANPTAEDLFNDQILQDIRLTIEPEAWKTLQDNYLLDDYYSVTFRWGNITVEKVGIRSRGSGSRNSSKPGLKVDFNQFVSGQKFLGLKSIVLDNLVQDPSMMAERLSMAVFRRLGIAAPREAHARLYINEMYAGLYTVVEPVDKTFVVRSHNEDTGQLYDYEWSFDYRFENMGPEIGNYAPVPFTPKTNEDDPDPALAQLIVAANEANDFEFLEAISAYLDPIAFLDYLAVETFVADIDGILGDWGMNNFYLYQRKGTTLLSFIPWDKDVTFLQTDRSIWENSRTNVLVMRLLDVPSLRDHYLRALQRCIDTAEGPGGWLDQEVNRIEEQIRMAALEDTVKPSEHPAFSDSVLNIRNFVANRPNSISSQIFDGRTSGMRAGAASSR